jgi:pimeloyl-ACP methyl ester carboxylesterase
MDMVDDATVRTPGGRTLAYAQTGQPDGIPVFYFHGIPGSRLDFHQPFGQEALRDTGVRLIGIDRPGFGGSDYQPRRHYQDWPADVTAVAGELGIDRFGVLAYSAGGPYALACAEELPERIGFVGIVSGDGPAETPQFHHGMGRTDAIMTRLSRWAPMLGRAAIAQARRQAARSPEKFSRQFDGELSAPDLALHREPVMRQAVRDIFIESTRNGPRGVVEDYQVWAKPSGLDCTEIALPVHLWHGDADAVVPLHHAKYVAGLLSQSQLTVMPGVGHLHTSARWRDFLTTAVNQMR